MINKIFGDLENLSQNNQSDIFLIF